MDAPYSSPDSRPQTLSPWVYAIAILYFFVHLLTATQYGYFRDALYYLACSEHLAWGYVDQPPLIVFIGWLARHTLGTSLPALLLWPALAGSCRLILTAAFARELGASRFGTAFAALLAASPAVWYVIDHQFAMNAFEPLFWTGLAYAILRMIKTNNPRYWLAFGAVAGLGLENKYSLPVFAGGLLLGLLLTPQRKFLFSPWLFTGGAIALLLFLPNLLWNIHHHWPFVELMHNIRASGRDVVLSPVRYIAQQILITTPLCFPIWFTGLLYYFFSPDAKHYRAFGYAFIFTIGFFLLAHGKNYYSVPAYPLVLAAGAVSIDRFLAGSGANTRPTVRAFAKPVLCIYVLVAVGLLLPVVLPILPIATYLRFQQHLPFAVPASEHQHQSVALPQHYADEFGWEAMVAAVARVYRSLPLDEQAKTAIYASNYGQAAAIDFFGPQYGLPKAICGHQTYFLWGPRHYTGTIVIRLGATAEDVAPLYESVVIAATLDNPYALPYEKRPILVCRHLKANLQEVWPQVKHWD